MGMGTAGVDYPLEAAALSVLPLGADEALTSRVRRVSDSHLYISAPRDGAGSHVVLVERDLIELSWQADDGLRSVSTEVVVGVPQRDRVPAGQPDRPRGVDVVQRTREGDDTDAHSQSFRRWSGRDDSRPQSVGRRNSTSSMTGLASRVSAICRNSASSGSPSTSRTKCLP